MGAGDRLSNIPVLKPGLDLIPPHEVQPAADETARKLYADVQPALVKVVTDLGTSTGFFVGKDGQIMTAANNVIATREQYVVGADGKRYKAEITAIDDISGLATLKIKDGSSLPPHRELKIGTAVGLQQDQPTYSFGFPNGYKSPYLSPGYFRNITRLTDVVTNNHPELMKRLIEGLDSSNPAERSDLVAFLKHPILQNQQFAVSGYSGGPLLDKNGNVVGIARLIDNSTNSTYFSSGEAAKFLLNDPNKVFAFKYGYQATPWAEKYMSSWNDDRLGASVYGLAAGATGGVIGYAGYKALSYLPKAGGLCVGAVGASMLTSDASKYLSSTDSRDSLKYGLASLADSSTTGGAIMTLIPRARPYGMALIGAGLAGRLATEFIRNRWTLEETKRTDGTDRPPFDGHEYLR